MLTLYEAHLELFDRFENETLAKLSTDNIKYDYFVTYYLSCGEGNKSIVCGSPHILVEPPFPEN